MRGSRGRRRGGSPPPSRCARAWFAFVMAVMHDAQTEFSCPTTGTTAPVTAPAEAHAPLPALLLPRWRLLRRGAFGAVVLVFFFLFCSFFSFFFVKVSGPSLALLEHPVLAHMGSSTQLAHMSWSRPSGFVSAYWKLFTSTGCGGVALQRALLPGPQPQQ